MFDAERFIELLLHYIYPVKSNAAKRDIKTFVKKLKYHEVKDSEYILRNGQVCKSIYYIQKGTVRISYIDPTGNEKTLFFARNNEFATDYESFLKTSPCKYNIQCLEDVELVELTKETLEWGYANSFVGNLIGRKIVERKFIEIVERKHELLMHSPMENYKALLNRYPNIHNKIAQKHIASYLGITPVHLSRLRGKYAKGNP